MQSGSPWPLRLAILAGILSLLCVGGLGVGFHYYDKATKPDRSTPDVALANYIQAYLVDRNDASAAQFVCDSGQSLAMMQAFRLAVERKEKQIGASIGIGWQEHTATSLSPTSASIDVTLTESATVSGVAQTLPTEWVFVIVKAGGWRVCGATQTS